MIVLLAFMLFSVSALVILTSKTTVQVVLHFKKDSEKMERSFVRKDRGNWVYVTLRKFIWGQYNSSIQIPKRLTQDPQLWM